MFLACLLAATLAAIPQDPPHEPTVVERIDALIAKSNAYEHFVATYHYHSKTGEEGEVRLVFRAPDCARFEVNGEKSHLCMCFLEGKLEHRLSSEDEVPTTASVNYGELQEADLEVLRSSLAKQFPKQVRADDLELPDGLSFGVSGDADCESFGLDLFQGGRTRLHWLADIKRRPERASLGGDSGAEIVYKPCDDLRVFISAETGFISRIERDRKEGLLVGLSLIGVDLEASPSADDLRPPSAAPGARDDSERLKSATLRQLIECGRASLYRFVARVLDDGKLEWDDGMEQRVGAVIRNMHKADVRELYEYFSAPNRAWIDGLVEWARDALQGIGSDDAVQRELLLGQLQQRRGKLEENCDKVGEHLLELQFPGGRCKVRPALYDELATLEKRLLPEIFADVVTKPLLASFDEKVIKQFEAK